LSPHNLPKPSSSLNSKASSFVAKSVRNLQNAQNSERILKQQSSQSRYSSLLNTKKSDKLNQIVDKFQNVFKKEIQNIGDNIRHNKALRDKLMDGDNKNAQIKL
jgi:L-cysteine desulfidase